MDTNPERIWFPRNLCFQPMQPESHNAISAAFLFRLAPGHPERSISETTFIRGTWAEEMPFVTDVRTDFVAWI